MSYTPSRTSPFNFLASFRLHFTLVILIPHTKEKRFHCILWCLFDFNLFSLHFPLAQSKWIAIDCMYSCTNIFKTRIDFQYYYHKKYPFHLLTIVAVDSSVCFNHRKKILAFLFFIFSSCWNHFIVSIKNACIRFFSLQNWKIHE